jgi:hypothetical protein
MARHQGKFEAGRILLPKEAVWLADFEGELFAFPSGRHDDQVDAMLLFLDWYTVSENLITPDLMIIRVPFPREHGDHPSNWSD